jgi:hypothetical protein
MAHLLGRQPTRNQRISAKLNGCMQSKCKSRPVFALLLVALACGMAACGDDDKSGPAAQTQPSTSTTEQGGGTRSDRDRAGGSASETRPGDGTRSHGSAGSGGSRAPHTGRGPRKRSLQRYLAKHYRQTPWYPLLRKLGVKGGQVSVYLNFPPESDDEAPPVLACTAVRSYGNQVKSVTVYGSATPQGQTAIMKEC